ncbi:caspase family protein [Streptomyces decoyicus]|uniref:caspase family protein n=1 Tax=Streptomyces decoyicus TaxID=249567 RepID=UPI0004AAA86D|nr:caspase family protein [Streptomyces decoyicus]KOG46862.1 peptidase C14 [Streptomyces decoyicus]QZY14387.1 caspase family protein [Streptomyces decoyicus]
MATGLSLHLGLNQVDATKYGGWDGRLVACENDADDMARLAGEAGFEGTTLLTSESTVKNVTAELRKAAKKLKRGDILLFTYSGHGGQVPNVDGSDDEPDEFDETLVFYDREFLDDELHREFARFAQGVRILALLDCCHSGTGIEVREVLSPEAMEEQFQTRDPQQIENTARLMPVVQQHEVYQRDKEFFQELQRDLAADKSRAAEADALLISACQDNQLASDGAVNGKFTATLLDVWDGGSFRGGYRAFHRDILRNMPPTQSPNLYLAGRPGDAFLEQRPFTV